MKPVPRKKCVKDLHERLLYIIKELDSWDQKLLAARKRMRIKLRKEVENYVEPKEVHVKSTICTSQKTKKVWKVSYAEFLDNTPVLMFTLMIVI